MDREFESYGSEGEFIRKEIEPMRNEPNGINGATRSSWELVFKISQIAILPLLAAMLYLLTLINAVERQYAVIDAKLNSMPKLNEYITKIAVIEDRQSMIRLSMEGVTNRLDAIASELERHREYSDYEGPGVKRYKK